MTLIKGQKINRGVSINTVKFYDDFTSYRVDKGLSIEKACQMMDISSTIYQNILNGKRLDAKTVKKMRDHIEIELVK